MKYRSAFTATLVAVRDRVARPNRPLALSPADRLDGVDALVTGATGGLGRPIAEKLAARGARVTCAARSSAAAIVSGIEARGGRAVDRPVDLEDLRSIDALVASIDAPLGLVVLCAGIVPARARPTAQGFDVMIGVNYLASAYLVERLRAAGKLDHGRIVVVASESHRSAEHVDFEGLGVADDYGMGGVMRRYGYSKALLLAWAQESARRLRPAIAVHSICPGPVESRIAREAPRWAHALLDPTMKAFFSPADLAAEPVVYLACASALEGRTGVYFHRWIEKRPSELACDEAVASRLYDATYELLARRSAP
ncbi:MAG: SDR family NAD(P)-dependent oxidoreductase [Sandaracinaceae bacterium]|nr:SDR family NAD(P)-dependent oxidoreductase [Sandaracinaceae bacterium]